MCVCVCVRVCVRACVRACVRVLWLGFRQLHLFPVDRHCSWTFTGKFHSIVRYLHTYHLQHFSGTVSTHSRKVTGSAKSGRNEGPFKGSSTAPLFYFSGCFTLCSKQNSGLGFTVIVRKTSRYYAAMSALYSLTLIWLVDMLKRRVCLHIAEGTGRDRDVGWGWGGGVVVVERRVL